MQHKIRMSTLLYVFFMSSDALARGGKVGLLGGRLEFSDWVLPYLIPFGAATIISLIVMRLSMPAGVPWSMVSTVKHIGMTRFLFPLSQILMVFTGSLIFAGFLWH